MVDQRVEALLMSPPDKAIEKQNAKINRVVVSCLLLDAKNGEKPMKMIKPSGLLPSPKRNAGEIDNSSIETVGKLSAIFPSTKVPLFFSCFMCLRGPAFAMQIRMQSLVLSEYYISEVSELLLLQPVRGNK